MEIPGLKDRGAPSVNSCDDMPVLTALRSEFRHKRPLSGHVIVLHLHLTKETVALGSVLQAGGARVIYFPSNRQPAGPAILELVRTQQNITVSNESCLDELARSTTERWLVVEGSGRFFAGVHTPPPRSYCFECVTGISEHTSGGGHLVDAFHASALRIPVVAVYRDPLKSELETKLGTGQSAIAALLRALGEPVAGKRIVVVGFGRVGRGVAHMARVLGAHVTVVDTRFEAQAMAHLQGFSIATLNSAIQHAGICITCTGENSMLNASVLQRARDGLVLANLTDKPHEIDMNGCRCDDRGNGLLSSWTTTNGVRFFVLGGGLQVNHVVESGNPAELMDLSFSLHALTLHWMAETVPPPGLYSVPCHLRDTVLKLFLTARA